MYEILRKRELAPNVNEYVFKAERLVKHAEAGQFVILRVDDDGERVPFTICDFDREKGTLTLLIQTVGYTTSKLAALQEGDFVTDLVGPLGNPTDLENAERIMLVGGGIGTAVIYPQAKKLKAEGKYVEVILGARDESLLMYVPEFSAICDKVYIMTDNGSVGEKGFVTTKLNSLMEEGNKYDVVLAVGPMVMMRAVCNVTRDKIPTVVSMNAVMVDGTGMCGCCRVTVDGVVRYACAEGPEFDGHKIDFDEAIMRSRIYKEQEDKAMCRLRNGEIK